MRITFFFNCVKVYTYDNMLRQMFISVLLRMQKEDYAKVNIIALKFQT